MIKYLLEFLCIYVETWCINMDGEVMPAIFTYFNKKHRWFVHFLININNDAQRETA